MGIWHRIVSGLAATWITAGLAGTAQAEPLRLRYGIWVGYGPLFVAQEKGFFAKEGVEVEPIRIDDLTAAFASLFDDHVDSMMVSIQDLVTSFLNLSEPDDEPLVCILATDDSRGGDGILASTDIHSIADLEGNRKLFGTAEQPGPLYDMTRETIDVLSEMGELKMAVTPADVIAQGVWD